jgi:hypothetical protein
MKMVCFVRSEPKTRIVKNNSLTHGQVLMVCKLILKKEVDKWPKIYI